MPLSKPQKIHVHVYLHTHWDREWYRSFEGFRYRLCKAVNQVLTLLETGKIKTFLLDGQTIVLDDYLAIYPQQRERIATLVQQKRLQIGPWYILPDEFLVSGEALIRNLQIGIETACQFGQSNFCGYLPDMFGHIAQMPQILKQARLIPVIIWRGVSSDALLFQWQALDGTQAETIYLRKGYYQDFFLRKDEKAFNDLMIACSEACPPHQQAMLFPLGGDHLAPPFDFHDQLTAFNQQQSTYELKESTIDAYFQTLKLQDFQPEIFQGELREATQSSILPDVLSARIYLKVHNAALQERLEKHVEPFLMWAWLAGMLYPHEMVRQAWKYLLQNQPHDSICGCSIDQVHQEMLLRFQWAKLLCSELLSDAADHLFQRSAAGFPGSYLHVVNLSAIPLKKILPIKVEFPQSWQVTTFSMQSQQPLEILAREESEKFVSEIDVLPHWEPITCFSALLSVEVPPFSIQSFQMIQDAFPDELPIGHESPLTPSVNNHRGIKVELQEDQLYFYRNEVCYTYGHFFLDGGDAGDEYNYSPPYRNTYLTSHVKGWKKEIRALSQTLIISYALSLPCSLSEDRSQRTDACLSCEIETKITLYAHDDRIYFETMLDNQAKDHRLQVVFIPYESPFSCWASTAFGVLERKLTYGHAYDVPKGKERLAETFPYQDWIHLVTPNNRGFVLITQGLHEGSLVPYAEQQALAITFLRSVGWLSRDDLRSRGGGAGPRFETPDAQCLGKQHYSYSLGLSGNERIDALHYCQASPLVFQGHPVRDLLCPFSIQPDSLYISALKKADNEQSVILRCVNLLEHPVSITLKPLFPCNHVYLCNCLEENVTEDLLKNGQITLDGKPFEILTFKFCLA